VKPQGKLSLGGRKLPTFTEEVSEFGDFEKKKTKYNSLACHNSTICRQTLQSKLTEWNTNISDSVQHNTVEVRTGPTLYDRVIAKVGRYTFVRGLSLCFIEQSQKLNHDGTKR